jgi:hypothetical protein
MTKPRRRPGGELEYWRSNLLRRRKTGGQIPIKVKIPMYIMRYFAKERPEHVFENNHDLQERK